MKASRQESIAGHKPTAQDRAMMEKAIHEVCRAIDAGKAGVAALLPWHDEIVALGHNRYAETGDLTAHGEMVVLRSFVPIMGVRLSQNLSASHASPFIPLFPTLTSSAMLSCFQ